jgi:hypothetical protein
MIGPSYKALQAPPWPYDTMLDSHGLRLRPAAETGDLLSGRKMLELEEPPQLFDGVGTRGIPYAYEFVVMAHDGLILRNGLQDTMHTAQSIFRKLKSIAEAKATVPWIDPDGASRWVVVHVFQERRLSLVQPAWDISLTVVLRDPYPTEV